MKYGKFFAKVGKYAVAVFSGYEVHDQIIGPEKLLVPYVEKHVVEKNDNNDEPNNTILLYAILAVLLLVILFGAMMKTYSTMCKNATEKFKRSLEA